MLRCLFFFFFQAEDGIRDIGVTGVQTCALPISEPGFKPGTLCQLHRRGKPKTHKRKGDVRTVLWEVRGGPRGEA